MRIIPVIFALLIAVALLSFGCMGIGAPAAPVQNTTSSVDLQARQAAVQVEINDLNKEMQADQDQILLDEGSKDWSKLRDDVATLSSLTYQIENKTQQLCDLKSSDCTSNLIPIQRSASCANRSSALFEGLGGFASTLVDFNACPARCADGSETCLNRCNAILRDLKSVCTQLRAKMPDARQACTGANLPFLNQSMDDLDQVCRDVAGLIYLRNDIQNITPGSPANITPSNLTNPETIGPLTLGTVVLDPKKGAYISKYCTISAQPDVIMVGSETKILMKAYASGGERVTFSCGEGDPRSNGNGGLIDTFRICRYDVQGPTTVFIALDGYVCASAPLDVDPPVEVSYTPSCRVSANTQEDTKNGTTEIYAAAIRFRHQPASANLSFNCAGETFSKRLGDLKAGALLDDTALVSCLFKDHSITDTPGRVYIDGKDCGSMLAGDG